MGANQEGAYVSAGFKPNKAHACRLDARPEVRARIAELQERGAKRAEMTIADLVEQLAEDRAFAREQEAPAAAVSATMGQAKVLGLLRERIGLENPDGSAFNPVVIFKLPDNGR